LLARKLQRENAGNEEKKAVSPQQSPMPQQSSHPSSPKASRQPASPVKTPSSLNLRQQSPIYSSEKQPSSPMESPTKEPASANARKPTPVVMKKPTPVVDDDDEPQTPVDTPPHSRSNSFSDSSDSMKDVDDFISEMIQYTSGGAKRGSEADARPPTPPPEYNAPHRVIEDHDLRGLSRTAAAAVQELKELYQEGLITEKDFKLRYVEATKLK
jgi:hypothetical protein